MMIMNKLSFMWASFALHSLVFLTTLTYQRSGSLVDAGHKPTPKPTRKPTRKPTPKPTPKPTRKPTAKPTYAPDCKDYVKTDMTCYSYEDEIEVSFKNCDPEKEDEIAIYKRGTAVSSNEPLLWVRTCGSKTCTRSRTESKVYFDYSDWEGVLEPGVQYRAYLIDHEDYYVEAKSGVFEVKEHCYSDDDDDH